MKLAYEEVGQGSAVVLLHGFPLDRTMWRSQIEALGTSFRVIAPDLRGHGASEAPQGSYSVDEMADDVVELLDALDLREKVVVGGLSMGGYVAMSLVLRHEGRLRGLMLMNTRAAADPPSTARAREDLAQVVESSGKADAVVESMLPKLFAPSTYASRPEIVDRIKARMLRSNPRGIAGTLRGLAIRPDRTSQLTRIPLPTLVLAGADDQMIPTEEARRLAEEISGSELVLITESGHLAPLENPTEANAAILNFLNRLGA